MGRRVGPHGGPGIHAQAPFQGLEQAWSGPLGRPSPSRGGAGGEAPHRRTTVRGPRWCSSWQASSALATLAMLRPVSSSISNWFGVTTVAMGTSWSRKAGSKSLDTYTCPLSPWTGSHTAAWRRGSRARVCEARARGGGGRGPCACSVQSRAAGGPGPGPAGLAQEHGTTWVCTCGAPS